MVMIVMMIAIMMMMISLLLILMMMAHEVPIVLPSEDAQQTCSSLVVVGPKTASKWQLQDLTTFF